MIRVPFLVIALSIMVHLWRAVEQQVVLTAVVLVVLSDGHGDGDDYPALRMTRSTTIFGGAQFLGQNVAFFCTKKIERHRCHGWG